MEKIELKTKKSKLIGAAFKKKFYRIRGLNSKEFI